MLGIIVPTNLVASWKKNAFVSKRTGKLSLGDIKHRIFVDQNHNPVDCQVQIQNGNVPFDFVIRNHESCVSVQKTADVGVIVHFFRENQSLSVSCFLSPL